MSNEREERVKRTKLQGQTNLISHPLLLFYKCMSICLDYDAAMLIYMFNIVALLLLIVSHNTSSDFFYQNQAMKDLFGLKKIGVCQYNQ